MPLDAPVVARLAQEVNSLLPAKIDKIYQPYHDEFLFSCFGLGKTFKILFSLNAQFGRFHVFDGNRENPVNPSAFCMLLRKHFGGSKLIGVTTIPFERIAKFSFEVYEEYLGLTKKTIWLELTAKSSNLIITDEAGLIIDAWRRVNAKKPEEREILPGLKYELPPTGGRWQPVNLSAGEFLALASRVPAEVSLEKFLLKHWYGLSSLAVSQITRAAQVEPSLPCGEVSQAKLAEVFQSFQDWANLVGCNNLVPTAVYNQQGQLVDCAAFPVNFPSTGLTSAPVESLNQAVVEIFDSRQEQSRFGEAKQALFKKISAQIEKTSKKLNKQLEEARQAEQGDELRISGELLNTYGFQIAKGSSQVSLSNHYDPNGRELTILLDPSLTPQENARVYFKKYQKAKKGQIAIAEQIDKTQSTLDYLESIAVMIENANNQIDLKLVREELEQAESASSNKGVKHKNAQKKEAPAEPRHFMTPAGHTILVGRNNLQNDKLTFKIAEATDWWFHTQKIPGSHVILRPNPGIAIDDESLNYACQLAVYFSKARPSTKVPVDYTQRKNVKKPPGAKPGFVIYDFFKTAIITPDQQILAGLGVGQSDQS